MLELFLSLILTVSASNKDDLTIFVDNKETRYTQEQLLKNKDTKVITLSKDPISGQPQAYYAIALSKLLKPFVDKKEFTIHLKAKDGMNVGFKSSRLLSFDSQSSTAYLAVKPKNTPWAKTKRKEAIGPYYLIWVNPEKSNIGPEEWPYQIVSIELSASVDSDLNALLPQKNHKNYFKLKKGYDTFVKNCYGCHTVNKKGQAELGPDLNYPHSPTEYFKRPYLIKYIRNPQALRHWPQSRMPAFDKSEISDPDLEALISYLEYLAQQRK